MKRFGMTLAIFALAAFSTTASATHCTNGAPDSTWPGCVKPANPPSPQPIPSSTSNATSNAGAVAGAAARGGAAKATGGAGGAGYGGSSSAQQGQGQTQGQGLDSRITNASNDNSSFRSSMYILPAPVFTPPLPMPQCPNANVQQDAFAVGWNFLSHASGTVNTDNCTAFIIYNNLLAQCRYASAQQLLDLLSVKILPGFKSSGAVYVDLSQRDCSLFLNPPAQVSAPVVKYETIFVPTPCTAPPAKKGKKHAAKKPVTCTPHNP